MTNIKLLELLDSGKIEEAKNGLAENIRDEIEKGKGTKKSDARIIREICNTEKRGCRKMNTFLVITLSILGLNGVIFIFEIIDFLRSEK